MTTQSGNVSHLGHDLDLLRESIIPNEALKISLSRLGVV